MRQKVTCTIPEHTLQDVDALKDKLGLSRSETIARLLDMVAPALLINDVGSIEVIARGFQRRMELK